MADVAEEVVTACCSPVLAAGLEAATTLAYFLHTEATPAILVHANSFSSSDEFSLVFHILGSFCTALIKFSVLTIMSIEFCSIFNNPAIASVPLITLCCKSVWGEVNYPQHQQYVRFCAS